MLDRLIMILCSINYRHSKSVKGFPIMFIKGTEKHYPKYLLYTEDENVYKRMEKF